MRALFIVVFYHGNRDTAPAMYYGDFMLAKIRAFLFEQQGRADSTDGVHSHEELHLAAAAGRRDVVQMLLAAGAQKDSLDKWKNNALNYAQQGKHDALTPF